MAGAGMVEGAEVEQLLQEEYEAAAAGGGRNAVRGGVVALLAVALVVAAVVWSPPTTSTASVQSAVGLAREAVSKGKGEVTAVAPVASSKDKGEAEEPPCRMEHADDEPSLFCWAVMFDDDKDLIKSQFAGRAGMFACNDFLVLAQEEMSIGKDDCDVERKTLKKDLPKVEKGTYGVNAMTSSWLNVPIFLIAWDAVIESNKVWENEFTVKLDPDAVFFPSRLGYQLRDHVGKAIYTTDCRYWGGDTVGKLFGSIEVVSKGAIGAYKGNKQTCKDLGWQGWGEDYWLQHCMDAIGVTPPVIIADWVTDTTCPLGGGADCGDTNLIVMHPYKDAGAWWECWKASSPE